MSYLEYTVKSVPTGFRKILHLNWPLTLLLASVCCIGFLMLYSVAGGSFSPWAEPQMKRFGLGLSLMLVVAMIPIWLWRNLSGLAYGGSLLLLVAVALIGDERKGSQRWIDLGFIDLQPSELMKITLVMFLAAYYDWLPAKKVSRPFWVLLPVLIICVPTVLVLRQPDLGTSILLLTAGRRADVPCRGALGLFCRRDRGGHRAADGGLPVARHHLAIAERLPVPPHRHLP